MRIDEFHLHDKNRIAASYYAEDQKTASLYDYPTFHHQSLMKRVSHLATREFQRDELVNYLSDYNFQYACSAKTLENIRKLRDPKSVAVIGGQQAGLLTGPLLTIHKCISILQFAKLQEERLGIPVVPVFWMAGEDHDYEEINHVFVESNQQTKKLALPQPSPYKTSATLMEWNGKKAVDWLETVFANFGETAYTNELMTSLKENLLHAKHVVSSFAQLLTELFGEFGLILVDSGEPGFKRLQKTMTKRLISENQKLDTAFNRGLDRLSQLGFDHPVEQQEGNAHLFFYHEKERLLLFRNGEDRFETKDGSISFTSEELLALAEERPECFSNNVVSRPLMQDFMFPVLAFVAGSGEIAYWSALKDVFSIFSFTMPPLVPRLSMTIVSQKSEKLLQDVQLPLEDVIQKGTAQAKQRWYEQNKPHDIQSIGEETIRAIQSAHAQLAQLAIEIDPSLEQLSEINVNRITKEVHYLQKKMEQKMKKQYKDPLARYDQLALALYPNNQLQERVWNVFYYMNTYGPTFVKDLASQTYAFNGLHKVVSVTTS
ncbi:hypothetical protein A374_11820 [Fictibacillus macauensis ZFHKF-1]|uniref:Putative cysteine ligase BshC n=1 Tax=Fictibacillus macauensis ZFHKF-1 TaxID=1196324 RepID=I8AHT7_9BACL|nr:bacillithiol biosynthesis cysteine-adding enzyme BshC [Fictibacillus macauensis]EIT84984.1 hypothetical protein A374_11820 [Fictibacillus macauensis ZFHKF-1]